jgi:predicted Zn finger-like uncharacterized protein
LRPKVSSSRGETFGRIGRRVWRPGHNSECRFRRRRRRSDGATGWRIAYLRGRVPCFPRNGIPMPSTVRCPTCRRTFQRPAGTTPGTLSSCPVCAAAYTVPADDDSSAITSETDPPAATSRERAIEERHMATFTCPECGANLTVAQEPAPGKRVRCPKCRKAFLAGDVIPKEAGDGADIDQSDPRNPLPKLGMARVACGGALLVLALLGLIHGSLNLSPVAMAGVMGSIFLVRGLLLLLQPLFWPPSAPRGILGHYRDIQPLLQRLPNDRSYLGTYTQPHGLFQLLTRLVLPQYNYLTPPIRPLFRNAGAWALALLLSLPVGVALMSIGFVSAALILPTTLLAALSAQIVALHRCRPRVPRMPQVEAVKLPTLTAAGNPKALVDSIVERELYGLRDGDTNRRYHHFARDTGGRQRVTEFEGQIALESLPQTVPLSDGTSSAATLLDWAGVAVSSIGGALLVFAPPAADHLITKLLALVPIAVGCLLLKSAYALRMTFRFRSTLMGVRFKGTIHGQRAGGEGAGFGTIERFHSELHVTITATGVLTECTAAWRTSQLPDEEGDAETAVRRARSALASPRYILEATLDEGVRAKVQKLAQVLQDYRDSHGEVMGADEESEGARAAIDAKLAREKQKILLEHQLRIQAHMQKQLLGKVLKDMTPDQLKQIATTAGAGTALLGALSVPPSPPPEALKLVREALRAYLTPGQPPDAKAANKRVVEELREQYQIPEQQFNELVRSVKAEIRN